MNAKYKINNGDLIIHDPNVPILLTKEDTLTFYEIPYGTQYTITESSHPDYDQSLKTVTGIITKDQVSITFRNFYNKTEVTEDSTLKVLKEVEGKTTDMSFDFILKYEDKEESVSLKDGESKEFTLPQILPTLSLKKIIHLKDINLKLQTAVVQPKLPR